VSASYTAATPYNGALDGRITRDGDDSTGSIIPITILHHNDSHGNLFKNVVSPTTTYVGYTQLATLIKQERAYNPNRTLLLSSGDNIQGDAMMYYFKSAPLGYAADGTPLTSPPQAVDLTTHPMMAAMNAMNYDAWTLGNHEFNFGTEIFTSVLGRANYTLQASSDDRVMGSAVPVPYVEDVGPEASRSYTGIGNHACPALSASNIPGSLLRPVGGGSWRMF
jgi:2',3'-cyclic-nucleotide 2'-phosphodiesterase (5'-nucleotidase family)